MNAAVAAQSSRLAPRAPQTRDWMLPIVIVVSLLVHATILVPLLWHGTPTPGRPHEIPIEFVPAPRPAAPPPAEPRREQPPAPNPAANAPAPSPKPEARKPAKPQKALAVKPAAKPASKPAAKPTESVTERMKSLLGPMPTAMPAIALPGETASGTDAASYSQIVLSKLAKAKKEGRHRGMPGRSTIAFSLGDAGEVASIETVRPSGDEALDAEAIAMVHRGEPYPAPPVGGRRFYQITLIFSAVP